MAIATPIALLEGLQVLVGGVLVVGLTWIGALQASSGRLLPGDIVTFFGYAGFLVMSIRVMSDGIAVWTGALIGAGKVLAVLDIVPTAGDLALVPAAAEDAPASSSRRPECCTTAPPG